MDMVPGHPNHIWLAADQPGLYAGACAEFCGVQHAWMRLLVIAHAPAEFAAWLEQQRQPAPGAVTTAAQGGRHVFEQLTCVNCHTIAGTGARPRLAPDLTHLASRRTLGAGVLENTPPNLVRWLHNPQAIKPGSHMPQVLLSEAQVQDLTAYLETLR
jgi:cytochrome c oxidase subunit 2